MCGERLYREASGGEKVLSPGPSTLDFNNFQFFIFPQDLSLRPGIGERLCLERKTRGLEGVVLRHRMLGADEAVEDE